MTTRKTTATANAKADPLRATATHTKEWLKGQIMEGVNYAHANGIDSKKIREGKWPV